MGKTSQAAMTPSRRAHDHDATDMDHRITAGTLVHGIGEIASAFLVRGIGRHVGLRDNSVTRTWPTPQHKMRAALEVRHDANRSGCGAPPSRWLRSARFGLAAGQ